MTKKPTSSMTMFLKLITLTLLTCITSQAVAQSGRLSGKLTDEKGAALKFANVAILKDGDSAFVAGGLAKV